MTNFFDEKYMRICSERTLQTNNAGFFLDFAHGLADIAGEDWIKKVFGKLQTDKQRIRTVYQDAKIKDILLEFLANVQEVYRGKCTQTAKKCRTRAEAALAAGNVEGALALASQGLLKAPKTGDSLSLAFFTRANIFIAMEEYGKALTDVQEALKENLPNLMKGEAFLRMGICHTALNDENKAKVAWNLARNLGIEEDRVNQAKSKKYCAKISLNGQMVVPGISGEKHPLFPCASRKIGVRNSKEQGRFVVAEEEITTGETLVVELPYAACLLPEKFGTHCHHCFQRLVAPIGCRDCAGVAFCSKECRNSALSTYHQYECKFLDLLIGSGMSILAHTALRMITQHNLERNLQLYRNRSEEKVFSLCTNSHKRPAADFLQRTLMAAFLLRCLQKSLYFGHQVSDAPNEEELQIGELLLFNLQMLQFNAHEIYETLHSPNNRLKETRPIYIGVAVYPTVALFNHQCYAGVTRYFVGKHIVINALRPLNRSDLIAENYGPVFTMRTLPERQRSLSARYWFNCQCAPCVKNWPTFRTPHDDSTPRRIKCPSCSTTIALTTKKITACPKCEKSLEKSMELLEWCERQYEKGFTLVQEQRPQEAIEIFCGALDIFHKVAAPPHRQTHLAQEALRVCLADGGNRWQGSLKK